MLRTLLVVRRNRGRVREQGGVHASCRARERWGYLWNMKKVR